MAYSSASAWESWEPALYRSSYKVWRVLPSMYSITMKAPPGAWSTSVTRTTWGLWICAETRASWRKRSTRPRRSVSSEWRNFSATLVPSTSWRHS